MAPSKTNMYTNDPFLLPTTLLDIVALIYQKSKLKYVRMSFDKSPDELRLVIFSSTIDEEFTTLVESPLMLCIS